MAYGTTPDRTTLRRWLGEELTHRAIAERWREETGNACTRTAVTMAVNRYGLNAETKQPRYEEYIPWSPVKREHSMNPHARNLRLLAKRDRGEDLSADDVDRLESWLAKLAVRDAVVHYDRDTEQGFWLVPREPQDGAGMIRRPQSA